MSAPHDLPSLPPHLQDQNDATIRDSDAASGELFAIEAAFHLVANGLRDKYQPGDQVTIAQVDAMLRATAGEFHRLGHVAQEAGR